VDSDDINDDDSGGDDSSKGNSNDDGAKLGSQWHRFTDEEAPA
jgi:hypothetical protein